MNQLEKIINQTSSYSTSIKTDTIQTRNESTNKASTSISEDSILFPKAKITNRNLNNATRVPYYVAEAPIDFKAINNHQNLNKLIEPPQLVIQGEELSSEEDSLEKLAHEIEELSSKEDSLEKLAREIEELSSKEDSLEELAREIEELSSNEDNSKNSLLDLDISLIESLPHNVEKDALETADKLINELNFDNDKRLSQQLLEAESQLINVLDSYQYTSQDSIKRKFLSEKEANIRDTVALLNNMQQSNLVE